MAGTKRDMPARWQLKRVKGYRKPPGVVTVARPTKWGNPFDWSEFINATTPKEKRREAVKAFEMWLNGDFDTLYQDEREEILESLPELAGKDLACWCPEDEPCHADVLIRLANKPLNPTANSAWVNSIDSYTEMD